LKTFQIISKIGCTRCEALKAWLEQNGIEFEERKIEDDDVQHTLVNDPKFTEKFCDIEGCIVHTPVLHIDETGDYYYKELFSQTGVRGSFVKKIIEYEE
jgi:glutaredoxin